MNPGLWEEAWAPVRIGGAEWATFTHAQNERAEEEEKRARRMGLIEGIQPPFRVCPLSSSVIQGPKKPLPFRVDIAFSSLSLSVSLSLH